MKQSEIIELSTDELQERLESSKKSYIDLKMAHAITPLEVPMQLRAIRRDVARLSTELTKRELQSLQSEVKMEKRNLRKERIGVVSSNKMEKSIVVAEVKKVKHPMYGKFVLSTKKYVAHDEKNDCNIGDTVKIMETRPMSKSKRWRLVEILERAK